MSEHYGFEVAVVNSGYSGDRTEYSRTDRLPKILRKSVKSDSAFLMTGTTIRMISNQHHPVQAVPETPVSKLLRENCLVSLARYKSQVGNSLYW